MIEVTATVESVDRGGYTDRFESGEMASYDEVTLRVQERGREDPVRLRIVVTGPPFTDTDWEPGMTVRFLIDPELLSGGDPIFSGIIEDLRVVGR